MKSKVLSSDAPEAASSLRVPVAPAARRSNGPSRSGHSVADVPQALASAGVAISHISRDVSLAGLSRWRVGGTADIVITPGDEAELSETIATLNRLAVPHVIIGDGSNLLFDDQGLRGVVVHIGRALGGVERVGPTRLRAGAGAWVPALVRHAISAGLSGIEHAIGIPGTFGGLCAMNGGSQRRGIGEHVVHVEVLDRHGARHRLSKDDMEFTYRSSRLLRGDLIMTGALLDLALADARVLRHDAIAIMAARRAKFPRIRANCGSVFVSDPALYSEIGPPGAAIEKAGLKGRRIGDAQISPEHANFIVNLGQARSADILALIALVRRSVADMTGIAMKAEVRYVAPDAMIRPAHEAAETLEAGE